MSSDGDLLAQGWVRARQKWEVDASTLSFKEGDALQSLIKVRTVDPVVFLDSKGRAYTVEASHCRPAAVTAPASSLVDVQGAHILFVVPAPDTEFWSPPAVVMDFSPALPT